MCHCMFWGNIWRDYNEIISSDVWEGLSVMAVCYGKMFPLCILRDNMDNIIARIDKAVLVTVPLSALRGRE